MKKLLIYSLLIFIGLGIVYDMAHPKINHFLGVEECKEGETRQ